MICLNLIQFILCINIITLVNHRNTEYFEHNINIIFEFMFKKPGMYRFRQKSSSLIYT